jgi:hypothetical protein
MLGPVGWDAEVIGGPLEGPGVRALALVGLVCIAVLIMGAVALYRRDMYMLDAASRPWRRLHFLTVALVAAVAIDLLPDLIEEGPWLHRADEFLVESLGLVAVGWFALPGRRLQSSWVPLAIAGGVELVKGIAIVVEWPNPSDVEGDIVVAAIGLPVFLVLAWLNRRQRRAGSSPSWP